MSKQYDLNQGRYLLPEATSLVYCFACLELALKKSKKAKSIYDRLVEGWGLSDIKPVLNVISSMLPNAKDFINILNEESEQKIENADKESRLWFPDANSYKNVLNRILFRRFNFVKVYLIKRRINRSGDFKYCLKLCDELVKVGFNKENDQRKRIYKITNTTSPSLTTVIFLLSFFESQGVKLKEEKGTYMVKMKGRYYDLTNIISPKTKDREHRRLSEGFINSGYSLHHAETLVQVAERWYDCRVVFSGIEEYCKEQSFKGINLDPANISNEIRDCDKAMGYPRGKH